MRELVKKAIFGKKTTEYQKKIREMAEKKGIRLCSLQKLYIEIAKNNIKGFTVPAFNIRTLTFDAACALFRAAKKEKVGAFIFEIARTEILYTAQSPEKYLACVLGAAIKENFKGPLFLQGDHFKISSSKYFSIKDKKKELKDLENLIKKTIKAGFYNVDIDCSALLPKENSYQTAKFTSFIRKIEPKKINIAIGGEVGEIGGKNTSITELKNFINNYQKELKKYSPSLCPIIKIAVQAKTSHGGTLLGSGKFKPVKINFKTLAELSKEAKKNGTAGIVQHGASTLPEKYFGKFPKAKICEIHLATFLQNIIYDSDYFPQILKEKIEQWLKENYLKKKDENDLQFFYRLRKNALGPFKKKIWDIPQKNINKICEQLETKFIFFFQKLNVSDTKDLIKKLYKISN
ncbi:class II fructose-bisphosphate aldolase [Patescibacteria group bacterium]|nr:class II fructose-bisphosphate aldolase [Patescibacteria group bacterium]